jgi:hypothetical protein
MAAGGGQHGGFDALGNAGPLDTYPILSVLPDKFTRFLFGLHSGRFESLDPPILPDLGADDRSQFDVHCAVKDDKVKQFEYTCLIQCL